MISPAGLVLIAAVATGLLVEECNLDLGEVVVTHKLTISNVSDVTMWASVYGQDLGGSYSLGGGKARTVTSYLGGKVSIAVAQYDVAPVIELQTEALQLQRILKTPTLSPAEAKAVNDRLTKIGEKLAAIAASVTGGASASPSGGQTHLTGCSVTLQPDKTVVVEVGRFALGEDPFCKPQ